MNQIDSAFLPSTVPRSQRVRPRPNGPTIAFTARKDAEDALRDSDRRKNEFLATLAHELR